MPQRKLSLERKVPLMGYAVRLFGSSKQVAGAFTQENLLIRWTPAGRRRQTAERRIATRKGIGKGICYCYVAIRGRNEKVLERELESRTTGQSQGKLASAGTG